MYKEQIEYQLGETVDFEKDSLSTIIRRTEEIINSHIDKDDYCAETYVHPRLKRVPDKKGFLEPLKEDFESSLPEHFPETYEQWRQGEFEFVNSDNEVTLANHEEIGHLIQDVESFKEYLESVLLRIDQYRLIDFLNDVKYIRFLGCELDNLERSSKTETFKGEAIYKAFVVHGHDEAAKEKTARFLEKLTLKPIILSECGGIDSIIKKIEMYSDVSFAVILLTPDDEGRKSGSNDLTPRARQNVILELGYFIARLGPENVFVLKKGNIELPSDYNGIMYISMDDGDTWKMKLAKEIKFIGIDVDLNRIID
ncbi:MAG: nucleotide-binding protein [Saprospiraceae bacterium]|nr:nucleotide-binding protein [Saprospiraceae bacterium]